MSEKEEKARRDYLKTLVAAAGGLIIGGVVGWYAKPREVLERLVTETITKATTETVTKTVTVPITPTTPPTPTVPPLEDWLREASKPYSGTTIKIVDDSTPSSMFYRGLTSRFTELTGIKFDYENTDWDDMYRKQIMDIEAGTGIYDATYQEQDTSYMYAMKKYSYNIKKLWDDHPELVWPGYDAADIFLLSNYTWLGGEYIVSIPMEGFLKTYWYRTDLFEDPGEKSKFKAKYGWDLRPPKTWDECEQIAEFFTRPEIPLYGFCQQAKAHACLTAEIEETMFPTFGVESPGFPDYPICRFGVNLKTLGASMAKGGLLDSPQAIKAIETYVRFLKYSPPGALGFTWTEEGESFAAGITAQQFAYSEFQGMWLDPAKSKIIGKFAPSLPPIDPAYHKFGEYVIGYYDGAGYGIPWCSKHPEAAWLWLQYITSPDIDYAKSVECGTVTRTSSFLKLVGSAEDKRRGGYFTFLRDYAHLFFGTPQVMNFLAIIDIWYKVITRATTGEITAKECCDELVKTTEAKIAEWGSF